MFSTFARDHGQYYIFVNDKKCELSKCDFISPGFWEAESLIQEMGESYKIDDQRFRIAKKKIDDNIFKNNKGLGYELRFRVIAPIDFVRYGSTKLDESRASLESDTDEK